jgi:hypothetical protein
MKTRLVFSGLLTVVFVVGIGVGFLAAPHRPRDTAAPVAENESIQTPAPPALKRARPVYRVSTHGENVASTPDSDPGSEGGCRIGYHFWEDFFSDVPTVEKWHYPGSKITRKDVGGGGSTGVIEWGSEERLVMTTPDNVDKVWKYYQTKLGLKEEGDMSGVTFGAFGNEPGKITFSIHEDLNLFTFPMPKSHHVGVKLFSMDSQRYHVVVCIIRANQDVLTSIAVAYRQNKEALSLLGHLAKTDP